MPAFVAVLARLAAPWADLYNGHAALQTAVAFLHIGGLLVAGGIALATDRLVLRTAWDLPGERARTVREVASAHATVLTGLAVVALSGVLLFAADVKTFATSPAYWAKLGVVFLLLANGYRMTRIEARLQPDEEKVARDDADWARLRFTSRASIALWLGATLLGAVLVNAT